MNMDDVLTTVRGQKILVSDVVTRLKANGVFRRTIYELIEQYVIDLACEGAGLTVEDEDFLRRRERKKMMMGLSDPLALNTYMKANGLTYDAMESYLHHAVMRDVLKESLVTEDLTVATFKRRERDFASVKLARIVVSSRKEADKLLRAARTSTCDFGELARDASAEGSTRFTNGYLGEVRRGMLPTEVDAAVFAAVPGDVVGPFQESGLWSLYKICDIHRPELTDSLRAYLHDQIFDEWLRHQVNTVLA